MTPVENACPLWGSEFTALTRSSEFYDERIIDCRRCGGEYRIDGAVDIGALSPEEKSRLTTWLVDRRALGDVSPRVTNDIIDYIKKKAPLSARERADRLLRFVADNTKIGDSYTVGRKIDPAAYAYSESTRESALGHFINDLLEKGWLGAGPTAAGIPLGDYEIPKAFWVTIDGRSHIDNHRQSIDSSQGFIAMWFDESMAEASRDGIEAAIVDAGYAPIRIDRKLDVRKIDDEIIAEIRRSRFLVADCTHGETKSRGSVYWEAGFAYGLGKEVIYTCCKKMADELPFDTRQYPYIFWETPEDLRGQLKDRILARLGDGPGVSNTS